MYPYIYIVLPSYGTMAFLGGFVILVFLYFRLERYGIVFTSLLKYFVVSLICGFVGSKLLFAITQIPWLVANFSFANLFWLIPESGLVFYGGLFGVIFALLICTRKDDDLRRRTFQMVTPAMPLFHGFGRIGCFLAGCCYGKDLASPFFLFGIEFTQVPVQLIESIFEFLLFGILMFLAVKKPNIWQLRVYLITYAVFRFVIEFWRGDDVRGVFFGLSTSQWISILILIYYLVRWIQSRSGGQEGEGVSMTASGKEGELCDG